MNAHEICAQYPNFDLDYETGGGCRAFHHPLNDGGYILVTTPEDAYVPEDNDTEVRVGRYGENGSAVGPEEGVVIPVSELEAWIDVQLQTGDAS